MSAIDVILVRYCPYPADRKMWAYTMSVLAEQPVNVLWRDNTEGNIGLVAARNELVKQSTAPVVVFMDFDFERIDIDFQAMAGLLNRPDIGMVVPYSQQANTGQCYPGYATPIARWEWQEVRKIPCNCMMLPREIFDLAGGFYDGYHTAAADKELIRQVWKMGLRVIQHNASGVVHVGRSSTANPDKRQIWNADEYLFQQRRPLWETANAR